MQVTEDMNKPDWVAETDAKELLQGRVFAFWQQDDVYHINFVVSPGLCRNWWSEDGKSWHDSSGTIVVLPEGFEVEYRGGPLDGLTKLTNEPASLPPPGPEHPSVLTVEEAAQAVWKFSGVSTPAEIIKSPDDWRNAYRVAAAKLHPAKDWQVLQDSKTLLDELHDR